MAMLDSSSKKKVWTAQEMGRAGGLKGGPARARALSPRKRRELARRAALARWSRKEQ